MPKNKTSQTLAGFQERLSACKSVLVEDPEKYKEEVKYYTEWLAIAEKYHKMEAALRAHHHIVRGHQENCVLCKALYFDPLSDD